MITNFYKVKHRQKGQVLLIVILTLVVALTIGLSIASRSIWQELELADCCTVPGLFML